MNILIDHAGYLSYKDKTKSIYLVCVKQFKGHLIIQLKTVEGILNQSFDILVVNTIDGSWETFPGLYHEAWSDWCIAKDFRYPTLSPIETDDSIETWTNVFSGREIEAIVPIPSSIGCIFVTTLDEGATYAIVDYKGQTLLDALSTYKVWPDCLDNKNVKSRYELQRNDLLYIEESGSKVILRGVVSIDNISNTILPDSWREDGYGILYFAEHYFHRGERLYTNDTRTDHSKNKIIELTKDYRVEVHDFNLKIDRLRKN